MSSQRIARAVGIFACIAFGFVVRAADPEPLPSAEELRKLFADAQYQPFLLKVQRVLQLKGNLAKGYDRVEMQLLRADSLLETKQSALAMAAVGEAVKAIDDQTDPKLAAQARATAALFKRTQAYNFTPKNGPKGQAPKPISVLDLAARKEAFTALLGDLNVEVAAKTKSAKAGKSLAPILEAARSAGDLRAVELTATGADTDSQKAVDDMAGIAKALTADGVKDLDRQAAAIKATADKLVPGMAASRGNGTSSPTYHKQGLTTQSTRDLKAIIDTSQKIQGVAKDFADASKASADAFKAIQDDADKVIKSATDTLNADYTQQVVR